MLCAEVSYAGYHNPGPDAGDNINYFRLSCVLQMLCWDAHLGCSFGMLCNMMDTRSILF